MKAGHLQAITVMQDVHTGCLVVFAASDPETLDVTTPLLPLSTVKLLLAASWWDHGQPETFYMDDDHQFSVSDMVVTGNDNAGRRLALALRRLIGREAVLKDFNRYGFNPVGNTRTDVNFWSEIAPEWKSRLTPITSGHSLASGTATQDWEDTLSIGEARFTTTALHLSRFLQAVGNGGVMLAAVARAEQPEARGHTGAATNSTRIMQESTARKLRTAMCGVVQRGTAKSVGKVLAGTGWQIGGKTGTGPGPDAPGPQSDGWFAGLVFDPNGNARFTVATFVRHGGLGGGNAARISAELARFLIGADSTK
jgi:cell division protein FtsI/penicillin-binding protein 2